MILAAPHVLPTAGTWTENGLQSRGTSLPRTINPRNLAPPIYPQPPTLSPTTFQRTDTTEGNAHKKDWPTSLASFPPHLHPHPSSPLLSPSPEALRQTAHGLRAGSGNAMCIPLSLVAGPGAPDLSSFIWISPCVFTAPKRKARRRVLFVNPPRHPAQCLPRRRAVAVAKAEGGKSKRQKKPPGKSPTAKQKAPPARSRKG